MSYISHVDYKSMMENFKKGSPKQMLKEDFERPSTRETEEENELGRITDVVENVFANDNKTSRNTVDNLAEKIRNAWSKSRGYGQGDEVDFAVEYLTDWAREARSAGSGPGLGGGSKLSRGESDTIWGDDWESVIQNAAHNIDEGNAFTAGLAKAKKGQEFKVDGHNVKDTSNYDSDLEEYQFDDMYPEDPGPFEGEIEESHEANDKWYEDFENGLKNLAKNKYISPLELQHYMKALDHVDPMDNYSEFDGHDAAKEFVDDLRTKSQMDADDYQWKSEHGGYDFDAMKEEVEFDDDEDAKEARAKKMEDDDTEAENAEREDLDEEEKPNMHDPNTVAKIVAQKHPELKKMFDEYQASHEQYMQMMKKPNAVNSPEFQSFVKGHNALWKKIENEAISWAGDAMLEAGESKVAVRNLLSGYGYFEDWAPDFLDSLKKELKGVAEGLHMPPLQATGPTVQTVEEDAITNPGMGFGVLSPDERQQLKEYINSYRTIKTEISKLLEKAGKSGKIMEGIKEDEAVPAERPAHYNEPTKTPKHKHSNLGGNRTGLVMTKAEMWEHDEEHEGGKHEEIEAKMDPKIHDAFHKVTDMAIKQLVAAGVPEDQAMMFLQHEMEEKGEEAMMSQYDLHEGKSFATSKNSKEAQDLKKGDVITSGEVVVSVSAGAKTPSGKVEVTLKGKNGKTRSAVWGKTTKVGTKSK